MSSRKKKNLELTSWKKSLDTFGWNFSDLFMILLCLGKYIWELDEVICLDFIGGCIDIAFSLVKWNWISKPVFKVQLVSLKQVLKGYTHEIASPWELTAYSGIWTNFIAYKGWLWASARTRLPGVPLILGGAKGMQDIPWYP